MIVKIFCNKLIMNRKLKKLFSTFVCPLLKEQQPNIEDVFLDVPVGTAVKKGDTGEVLFEMVEPFEERILVKGGRGGLGNNNFRVPPIRLPVIRRLENLWRRDGSFLN